MIPRLLPVLTKSSMPCITPVTYLVSPLICRLQTLFPPGSTKHDNHKSVAISSSSHLNNTSIKKLILTSLLLPYYLPTILPTAVAVAVAVPVHRTDPTPQPFPLSLNNIRIQTTHDRNSILSKQNPFSSSTLFNAERTIDCSRCRAGLFLFRED